MSLIINPYSFGKGVVTPLLDVFSGAAAAYSVRKLRTAYTGNALRVRRSNDNTESDIGFDGSGKLDEAALTSFVGANDGYVTKWYDQSGNGRDASHTTTTYQPRIASSGVIDNISGTPALNFEGGNKALLASALASVFNGEDVPLSFFGVYLATSNANYDCLWSFKRNVSYPSDWGYIYFWTNWNASNPAYWLYRKSDNTDFDRYAQNPLESPFNTNTKYLVQLCDSGTSVKGFYNGQTSDSFNNYNVNVGYIPIDKGAIGGDFSYQSSVPTNSLYGKITEMIFYNTDKSSDRTGIRNNINNYFGVY